MQPAIQQHTIQLMSKYSTSPITRALHFGSYAREYLGVLYGEDNVCSFTMHTEAEVVSMYVIGLFVLWVGPNGRYTINVSKELGYGASYFGESLDLVLEAAGKNYPELKTRLVKPVAP